MKVNNTCCPGCKQSVDQCPYGGDCLEMQAIYREQQKELLQDIDVEGLEDCMECGNPVCAPGYFLCYDCEHRED